MDAPTQIAIERAKAEKKNAVVLWVVNIVWPGLGNIVVGQAGLGILFGLLQWVCIGLAVLTLGLGAILLLINWVVASAVGHSRINKQYSDALVRIQAKIEQNARREGDAVSPAGEAAPPAVADSTGGTPATATCPSCGAAVYTTAKICSSCWKPLR